MGNGAVQRILAAQPDARPQPPGGPGTPLSEVQPALANRTGLPDALKAGIEALSGYSMDDVRVHRNSSRPAQFQAHAYTQGTDIHLASGQERHLPHEAWHVVQQIQGRVKPTMEHNATAINDDPGLEFEADRMGARALATTPVALALHVPPPVTAIVQREIAKVREDKTFDATLLAAAETVATDLDKEVSEAASIINNDPLLKKVHKPDGYMDQWVATFKAWITDGKLPPFFYARYGYAVEAMATRYMAYKKYHLVWVNSQVAHGATRPDFVVTAKKGATEVAWLDITSSGSRGHIQGKQHSGWKTRPYVAEILYDPPDLAGFARNPTLSTEQQKKLKDVKNAQLQTQEDYQRGADELVVLIENTLDAAFKKKGSGLSKADVRYFVTDALRPLLKKAVMDEKEVTVDGIGEVLRCMEEVKVGDDVRNGASWANAFSGTGTKRGEKLIIAYGESLRTPPVKYGRVSKASGKNT